MQKGLMLEEIVSYVLGKLGILHEHVDFERYNFGYGCDFTIYAVKNGKYFKIQIECKNLNGRYMLSPKWIIEEIHERYDGDCNVKVVVCSKLNVSCKTRVTVLSNIDRIIELGEQVNRYNKKKSIHLLFKRLYWIKMKFGNYIVNRSEWCQRQATLNDYVNSSFNDCLVYNAVIDVVGFDCSSVFFKVIGEKYGT